MNMFTAAKTKTAPAAKGKGKAKVEVQLSDLENYATICATIEQLEALRDTFCENVKGQVEEYFVETGTVNAARPENFKGVEGAASASCELRKRSTRSALTAEEVAELEALDIPVGTETVQEGCFIINPAYSQDDELLAKVAAALGKVKGLPLDFIQRQEAVERRVVTDETIAAVFRKGLAERFFKTVGVLALKPKVDGFTIQAGLNLVKRLVGAK